MMPRDRERSDMRIKGIYEHGSIRLLEDAPWPSGTSVTVVVEPEEDSPLLKGEPLPPGFFDELVGAGEGGPNDAENHDLLIYRP
jgi:hypothetical protein